MFESAVVSMLAALFLAALVRHLFARGVVARLLPDVQTNLERFNRGKARADAMEASGDEPVDNERRIRLYEEEGASFKPLAMLIGFSVAQWLLGLSAVWVGLALHGGPLAENVWWAGPVFVLVSGIFGLASGRKSEGRVGRLATGVFALLFGSVFAVLYAFAPVGLVAFLAFSTVIGRLSWRIVPYRTATLPPIAALFL